MTMLNNYEDRRSVIYTAAALLSEQGENPEYDRALVELIAELLGFSPAEDRPLVEALLDAARPPSGLTRPSGLTPGGACRS